MVAAASPAALGSGDLVGVPAVYRTSEGDTLLDIARSYDLGYVEIRAANPGIDPWLPGAGKVVVLPMLYVLPDAPRRGTIHGTNKPSLLRACIRPGALP